MYSSTSKTCVTNRTKNTENQITVSIAYPVNSIYDDQNDICKTSNENRRITKKILSLIQVTIKILEVIDSK